MGSSTFARDFPINPPAIGDPHDYGTSKGAMCCHCLGVNRYTTLGLTAGVFGFVRQ